MAHDLTLGNLTLRPLVARAELDGVPLDLTHDEYRLLAALARFAGEVVPYEAIGRMLWSETRGGARRTGRAGVRRARRGDGS